MENSYLGVVVRLQRHNPSRHSAAAHRTPFRRAQGYGRAEDLWVPAGNILDKSLVRVFEAARSKPPPPIGGSRGPPPERTEAAPAPRHVLSSIGEKLVAAAKENRLKQLKELLKSRKQGADDSYSVRGKPIGLSIVGEETFSAQENCWTAHKEGWRLGSSVPA